ncbi:MAG TPA: STAS domain-containing protein [Actinomycetota bacterium]|nr:STAS domain-containing protein [Actinomycetota bacterium]
MSEVGPRQVFAARSSLRNGVARIAVEGELDLASVPRLTQRLAEVDAEADGQGPPHLLLDLRGLTLMDSSGLRELLSVIAGASQNGRRYAVIGVAEPVRKVFELTGSGSVLDGDGALELIQRFTGATGGGAPG